MAPSHKCDAQATTRFPYDPLQPADSTFRLIRPLSMKDGKPHYEMRTFPIYITKYKSLSYEWGSLAATETIWLNDGEFNVRPNLFDFLVKWSEDEGAGWIFVDAICINQRDIGERNQQVPLMGRIYGCAEEVMLYIPVDLRDEAHQILLLTPEDLELMAKGSKAEKEVAEQYSTTCNTLILMSGVWTRLWVLQEVLLASRLTIMFANSKGDADLLFSDMLPHLEKDDPASAPDNMNDFISNMRDANAGQEELIRADIALSWRAHAGTKIRQGHLLPLYQALTSFGDLRCQDKHDKVFALLGMATTRIVADYDLPLTHLFIDAMADSLISLGFEPVSPRSEPDPVLIDNDHAETIWRLGHAIFRAFDTTCSDLWTFHIICKISTYFAGTQSDRLVMFLHMGEFLRSKWTLEAGRKMKRERKWYETDRLALRRHNKERKEHLLNLHSQRDDAESENETIVAPWPGESHRAESKTCEEWTFMTTSRCKALWQRYLAQQGHETRQAQSTERN